MDDDQLTIILILKYGSLREAAIEWLTDQTLNDFKNNFTEEEVQILNQYAVDNILEHL